jgi:hypothetical protein
MREESGQLSLTQRRIIFSTVTVSVASCAGMKVDILGGETNRSLAFGLVLALAVVMVAILAAWPWVGPGDGE